jgi:hypothetical protein
MFKEFWEKSEIHLLGPFCDNLFSVIVGSNGFSPLILAMASLFPRPSQVTDSGLIGVVTVYR